MISSQFKLGGGQKGSVVGDHLLSTTKAHHSFSNGSNGGSSDGETSSSPAQPPLSLLPLSWMRAIMFGSAATIILYTQSTIRNREQVSQDDIGLVYTLYACSVLLLAGMSIL